MTTTTETAPVPTFDPAKECIDVLPLRAGHRLAITWLASASDYSPLAGFLKVDAPEGRTTYSVSECPATVGRTFHLAKLATDNPPRNGKTRGAESYVVECGPAADGKGDRCECPAWQYRQACRHADAVRTLILNRWL